MKHILIPVLLLMLSLVSGCGTSSTTGVLYEFKGQRFLVIDETINVSVNDGSAAFDTFTTRNLAVMRADGTFEIIANLRPDSRLDPNATLRTSSEARSTFGPNPFAVIQGSGTFVRIVGSGSLRRKGKGFEIRTQDLRGERRGGGEDGH